jgi:glycosyltransferase involved in cell wall biosynthesis
MSFWDKKSKKALLDYSINELKAIRQRNNILVVCAQPTGYSWLGVNIATKSLFPENTFEIPQYYSNSIFTDKELLQLVAEINKLDFKQIIWSGFALFYEIICRNLTSNIIQKVIYHGFLSELAENPLQRKIFSNIIRLAVEKRIRTIGFVKKGLALSVADKYHVSTSEIILPNQHIRKFNDQINTSNIKIGCLVNNTFRKNLHNMVFAASMIKDAEIHVFKTNELDYLEDSKIIYHNLMSHDNFIYLLGNMTLNLHVSFSESWGQILAESISLGVPCISSYTSSFFDYNEELKQKLVVNGFDDSWHIYKKIEEIIHERESLSEICLKYAQYLNELAKDKILEFSLLE